MKLLNNLLKRHGNFTPTEAQFRFLVTFCFGDLEADQGEAHRSTTFALMRAVLARRPLLPEVYDVMKTVSSLVVRAGAAETRALCSQALVQFLLDYPLGERRLRQHIDLIAANLEYVYASGRQSALRCVRDLSVRFPKDVVAHHAPFLFVPLVARLGADEDAACRKGAGEALHALLKRVGSERSEKDGEFGDASNDGVVKKLLSLCVGWLNVAADVRTRTRLRIPGWRARRCRRSASRRRRRRARRRPRRAPRAAVWSRSWRRTTPLMARTSATTTTSPSGGRRRTTRCSWWRR
jgi:U3 small nucleolar RNA-associated protein 20